METNDPNLLPPNQFSQNPEKPIENKKMAAGLCAILIGALGIHKFVLGYNTEGTIILVVNLVLNFIGVITCGLGYLIAGPILGILWVITLIEGIIYLTKPDEEFIETYQKNKKAWF